MPCTSLVGALVALITIVAPSHVDLVVATVLKGLVALVGSVCTLHLEDTLAWYAPPFLLFLLLHTILLLVPPIYVAPFEVEDGRSYILSLTGDHLVSRAASTP